MNDTLRINAARTLANDIDRLAYLIDPYEYWDVIGGRTEADIQAHVNQITDDLLAGYTNVYYDWLLEQVTNESNDYRDRARAAHKLARLMDWIDRWGRD